jgi:hypothetical protein
MRSSVALRARSPVTGRQHRCRMPRGACRPSVCRVGGSRRSRGDLRGRCRGRRRAGGAVAGTTARCRGGVGATSAARTTRAATRVAHPGRGVARPIARLRTIDRFRKQARRGGARRCVGGDGQGRGRRRARRERRSRPDTGRRRPTRRRSGVPTVHGFEASRRPRAAIGRAARTARRGPDARCPRRWIGGHRGSPSATVTPSPTPRKRRRSTGCRIAPTSTTSRVVATGVRPGGRARGLTPTGSASASRSRGGRALTLAVRAPATAAAFPRNLVKAGVGLARETGCRSTTEKAWRAGVPVGRCKGSLFGADPQP